MIADFLCRTRVIRRLSRVLILLLALGACAQPSTLPQAPAPIAPEPPVAAPPEPDSVQRIAAELPLTEPVQAVEVAPRIRDDWVIVIPKPDGSVGSVVVYQNGEATVLDTAWAAARIEGPGRVAKFSADAAQVSEAFAETRDAMPARPKRFILYFQEGSDQLTVESDAEVERVMDDLAASPAPEIEVIGHTDTVGTLEFNDRLSLQRAERMRGLLIGRGMSAAFVTVAGRGERELLVDTPDNTAEAQNRRVEISVR